VLSVWPAAASRSSRKRSKRGSAIGTEGEEVRGGSFADLVRDEWIPLSTALNELNGSMGRGPLYPFVLPEPVLQKLEFVASLMPVRN